MVLLPSVSELTKSPPLPDPPPRWGEGTGGGQTVAKADAHEPPNGSLALFLTARRVAGAFFVAPTLVMACSFRAPGGVSEVEKKLVNM